MLLRVLNASARIFSSDLPFKTQPVKLLKRGRDMADTKLRKQVSRCRFHGKLKSSLEAS